MSPKQAKKAAAELASDPRVLSAEPSLRFSPMADVMPDDPLYLDQWDLGAAYLPSDDPESYPGAVGVRMEQAWGFTKGEGAAPVIAVLDTGSTAHADLAGRWVDGHDFVSGDPALVDVGLSDFWQANDGDGWDTDPSDPGDWVDANEDLITGCGVSESSWHGTHVAGTIGATPDNTLGIAGMVWGARIQPVRVLGKCGGATEDIADAITWASGGIVIDDSDLMVPVNPTPAKVLNLSLGYGLPETCPTVLQTAITGAVARGSVVVVAAGNSDTFADDTPLSNCEGTISVAATSAWGDRAYYSNFGSTVDIAAPGGDWTVDPMILSTINNGMTVPTTATYGAMAGTSMAAPHVAAAAALYRSLPGNGSKTPAQVESALEASAHPFAYSDPYPYSCYGEMSCGAGILDVAALVGAREAGGRPAAPSDVYAESRNGGLQVSWDAPDSENANSYLVMVTESGKQEVVASATTSETSVTVPGLTNGAGYDVYVRAANSWGYGFYEGSWGTPLDVPLAPGGITGFAGDGQVALSWVMPEPDPVRAGVWEYEIAGAGQTLTTDQRTMIVDGLTNGQAYTFSVRASSVSGPGQATEITLTPKSGLPPVVPPKDQSVKSPPAKIADGKKVKLAKASNAGMAVNWKSSTSKTCKIKNDRVLVGVKAGKCKIKASNSGNENYTALSAAFTVSVKK